MSVRPYFPLSGFVFKHRVRVDFWNERFGIVVYGFWSLISVKIGFKFISIVSFFLFFSFFLLIYTSIYTKKSIMSLQNIFRG